MLGGWSEKKPLKKYHTVSLSWDWEDSEKETKNKNSEKDNEWSVTEYAGNQLMI